VGDIADEHGRYESIGAPVYWIHGNNDNFDAIAAGDLPPDLHHIPNGTVVVPDAAVAVPDAAVAVPGAAVAVPGAAVAVPNATVVGPASLRVAGLGGTFAPTWYETRAIELPHPKKGTPKATELADKRRHFVREQVDQCTRLRDVDILLTHEAPKPFRARPDNRGPDAGKSQINQILAAMRPRLHLFGHHHRFSDEIREGVRSVGLDLVTQSYLLIDAASLDFRLEKR
jgi:predicted phosphodiesterase